MARVANVKREADVVAVAAAKALAAQRRAQQQQRFHSAISGKSRMFMNGKFILYSFNYFII